MEPSGLGTYKVLDNKTNGKVYTELIERIDNETTMSVISSQFSIYAFRAMQKNFKISDLYLRSRLMLGAKKRERLRNSF